MGIRGRRSGYDDGEVCEWSVLVPRECEPRWTGALAGMLQPQGPRSSRERSKSAKIWRRCNADPGAHEAKSGLRSLRSYRVRRVPPIRWSGGE